MRLSTSRSHLSLFGLLAASALLSACAGDATAPAAPAAPAETSVQTATSAFVPSAAMKSLVGVTDGTYRFVVDPRHAQSLVLGANLLYLPANAICDLAGTSYGASHWNESCAPQTQPVEITAVVRNAGSARPSIDFSPAMRFNPDVNVSLYMYVPVAERHGRAPAFVMIYCTDARACIDESLTDPTLKTMTDRSNKIVFRRIKHFSGYLVSSESGDS